MKINFEITQEDYIKFNLYHMDNSKSQKRTYNFLRYGAPLIACFLIYFTGTKLLEQPKFYWVAVSIIFVVVWIVTYPKQYRKLIKKQTEKLLKEGDNSSIFGTKTLEINDEEIIVKGEYITETVSIKSIKDIKIYEDIILIYISSIMAHIIPRRYLDEESDKEFIKKLKEIK